MPSGAVYTMWWGYGTWKVWGLLVIGVVLFNSITAHVFYEYVDVTGQVSCPL